MYGTNCYYGCCREFSDKKSERRYIKRKEKKKLSLALDKGEFDY